MKRFFSRNTEVLILLGEETGLALRGVLLILLLLLAAAGSIYYFAGLGGRGTIGGGEQVQTSLVKKPMPPRPDASAAGSESKPSPPPQKVASEPARKTGVKPPAPVPAAAGQKASSRDHSVTGGITSKSISGKKAEKPAAGSSTAKAAHGAKPFPAREAVKRETKQEKGKSSKVSTEGESRSSKEKYTLIIGVYVMKKSMLPEKAKLQSAGLAPEISKGPKKEEPMNRLFIGSFDSYAEASLELRKVDKVTHSAFILPEKGKFLLYAGSYFENRRATLEQKRLTKAGLGSDIRKSTVPMGTFRLTAGSFSTKEQAGREAERLKKIGLKALVIKAGR